MFLSINNNIAITIMHVVIVRSAISTYTHIESCILPNFLLGDGRTWHNNIYFSISFCMDADGDPRLV